MLSFTCPTTPPPPLPSVGGFSFSNPNTPNPNPNPNPWLFWSFLYFRDYFNCNKGLINKDELNWTWVWWFHWLNIEGKPRKVQLHTVLSLQYHPDPLGLALDSPSYIHPTNFFSPKPQKLTPGTTFIHMPGRQWLTHRLRSSHWAATWVILNMNHDCYFSNMLDFIVCLNLQNHSSDGTLICVS